MGHVFEDPASRKRQALAVADFYLLPSAAAAAARPSAVMVSRVLRFCESENVPTDTWVCPPLAGRGAAFRPQLSYMPQVATHAWVLCLRV